MHISGYRSHRRRVKKPWSIGRISILLCLFPSVAYAHDPTGYFLLFGGVNLFGPLLLGAILFWWKRKELVANGVMVILSYIAGLITLNIVGLIITISIPWLILQVSPGSLREMIWVNWYSFLMIFLVVPIGSTIILARTLYMRFRQ